MFRRHTVDAIFFIDDLVKSRNPGELKGFSRLVGTLKTQPQRLQEKGELNVVKGEEKARGFSVHLYVSERKRNREWSRGYKLYFLSRHPEKKEP